jgi:hypothetical protein
MEMMQHELEPLTTGNQNDTKANKSDGFWCEIASRIAFNCRILNAPIQEQAEISSSKTIKTKYLSEMDSQIREVFFEIRAGCAQRIALGKQIMKLFDQVYDQKIQIKHLPTPLNIQNIDLDRLKDQ